MPSKATSSPPGTLDMPTEYHPALRQVLQDYAMLFKSDLGHTTVAECVIETGDAAPVKVPPCPTAFHYTECVHKQLEEMAREGIIRHGNSPWSALHCMYQRIMVKSAYVLTHSAQQSYYERCIPCVQG